MFPWRTKQNSDNTLAGKKQVLNQYFPCELLNQSNCRPISTEKIGRKIERGEREEPTKQSVTDEVKLGWKKTQRKLDSRYSRRRESDSDFFATNARNS